MNKKEKLNLIRIGVYTQLEGNYTRSGNNSNYRFRFASSQIEGLSELLAPYSYHEFAFDKTKVISVSSKALFQKLEKLGFTHFGRDNWNVPDVYEFGEEGIIEYLRAVIDCIGNVDIQDSSPYIKLSSMNPRGLKGIRDNFGGNLYGPYENGRRYLLVWKGTAAKLILDSLRWKFYNPRNQRGAELIQMMKWGEYVDEYS